MAEKFEFEAAVKAGGTTGSRRYIRAEVGEKTPAHSYKNPVDVWPELCNITLTQKSENPHRCLKPEHSAI